MDAKTLAERLNGREYGLELTKAEEQEAKRDGLVVVFGASDDLMELRGALDEEIGCYNGGIAWVVRGFVFETAIYAPANSKQIEAVWCGPNGAAWEYRTDIPHDTFNIYEDGKLYCVGIIFSVEDLP